MGLPIGVRQDRVARAQLGPGRQLLELLDVLDDREGLKAQVAVLEPKFFNLWNQRLAGPSRKAREV